MGLFDKKSLVEKLLQGFNSLSDEDKEKFKNSIVESNTEENAEPKEENEEPNENLEEAPKAESEETTEETPDAESDIVEQNAESTPAEETPNIEESVEEETESLEKEEDLQNGMEARLKALEEKLETILAEKEDNKTNDFGVSGFGKAETENINNDNRNEQIIKKLGGRAR